MAASVEMDTARAFGAQSTGTLLGLDGSDDEALPESVQSRHGAWLRDTERPGAAVQTWSGTLPCGERRGALAEAARQLVGAGGRTYWLGAEDPPRCALESLARSVLRFHSTKLRASSAADADAVTGAEWWVQVRGATQADPSIGTHWDSDETFKSELGEHVPPWLATVTYVTSGGAPTLVLPLGCDAHGRAVRASRPCGAFASFPAAGKHLAFDGRLLHGAPHDLAPPAVERITFLCNVWLRHTPRGLGRLPSELLAKLPREAPGSPEASRRSADFGPATAPEHVTVLGGADLGGRRELAIGYPFFHPPVGVRGFDLLAGLPSGATAYVPAAELDIGRR